MKSSMAVLSKVLRWFYEKFQGGSKESFKVVLGKVL